jgi:hypothetical protein
MPQHDKLLSRTLAAFSREAFYHFSLFKFFVNDEDGYTAHTYLWKVTDLNVSHRSILGEE